MSDEQTPETEGVEVAEGFDSLADAPVQETGQESSQGVDHIESGTTPELDAVAELTGDLQRLQAEFANYRKRIARDRELVREQVIAGTLTE